MDSLHRFRALSELVADPRLTVYKSASPDALSPQAHGVLLRHGRALLDHLWSCVEREYGIVRGAPFCVVYQGTRLCVVLVTTDAEKAVNAAALCQASHPSIAVVVGDAATVFNLNEHLHLVQRSVVMGSAESWLALPAALTYVTPTWLLGTPAAPPYVPAAPPYVTDPPEFALA